MSKWECCVCGNDEPCILHMVNDKEGFRPVCCPVDNTSGIKSDWLPVDEPVTKCSQLPKLTAEVFDRPDCPEWAKWAAVDEDGVAFFYRQKPSHTTVKWHPETAGDCRCICYLIFDSTDWQNSLIERPEKKETLPDWCKVGEYGYAYDSGYFKIIKIIDGGINLKVEWVKDGEQGTVFGCNIKCKKQARLRPWKGSESLNKVVITGGDTFGVVIGCTWSTANVSGQWINCKKLLADDYKQPDSSPCGVFEHLENGEWVK